MSKAILISGAARGLGRCLARHFAKKGHRIFLLDVDKDELEHTASVHLKPYASQIAWSLCDLRDVSAIREVVSKAAEFFRGHIDVLINNGGISSPRWRDSKTMEDPETMEQWQSFIETNLTAPFALSQACLSYMKTEDTKHIEGPGPCIINISSFRAYQSDPNQEGYAASKAGLLGLTHAMAISAQQWGIRVNLVAPGRIKVVHECKEADETGIRWNLNKDDVEKHPVNRAGTPEDIAEAVEYLIGAGFVTGQDLVVDGGMTKVKS